MKAVALSMLEFGSPICEKIFDVMDCQGGRCVGPYFDLRHVLSKELFFLQFFPRAEQERLKREYHSIRQRASENSTEYMQRFLRLASFLGQAAGTAEEQAKNFHWGMRVRGSNFSRATQQISFPGYDQKNVLSKFGRLGGWWNSGAGRGPKEQESRVPSEVILHHGLQTNGDVAPWRVSSLLTRLASNVGRLVFSGSIHDTTSDVSFNSLISPIVSEFRTYSGRTSRGIPPIRDLSLTLSLFPELEPISKDPFAWPSD
ncbi:zinc finger, CCHC-type, retrotransposon gag domain protein [Tanacetum coccineum]